MGQGASTFCALESSVKLERASKMTGADMPLSLRQAINDFGKPGYAGRCPPRGDKPHHHFRLSALSEPSLPVASSETCLEVNTLAAPYVLEFVELVSLYQRSTKHGQQRAKR